MEAKLADCDALGGDFVQMIFILFTHSYANYTSLVHVVVLYKLYLPSSLSYFCTNDTYLVHTDIPSSVNELRGHFSNHTLFYIYAILCVFACTITFFAECIKMSWLCETKD